MKKLIALVTFLVLLFAVAVQPTAAKGAPADQARALLDAGDYEAAIPLLREAAEKGDADSQNELAKCYLRGTGVEENAEEATHGRISAGL